MLPNEYFIVEERANKEVSFKLNLESKIEAKILDLSSSTGTGISDVLLSAYAYLFSQITGEDKIAIQAAVDSVDVIQSLDIELGNINKFADLVNLVNLSRKNTEEANTYGTKHINAESVVKDGLSVVPLLYKADMISTNYDILSVFDIAFEIGGEEGRINCLCRFNGKRLNKVKMKEFFGLYLKLLELLLE